MHQSGHISNTTGAADALTAGNTIDVDLAMVFHRLNHDGVALQERPCNVDFLSGGKSVGVLCAAISALNVDILVLDDPVVAITVERRASTVEGNQVRVSPECAGLLHHRCRRRDDFGRVGGGGCQCANQQPDEESQQGQQQQDAHGTPTPSLALLGDEGHITLANTNISVCCLSDPLATTRADAHHHAIAWAALFASHAADHVPTSSSTASRSSSSH
mmetsp:Transcript_25401/g.55261  ORF Transcript_25401/g.55261 Transcript_25401/m.55261 type:complete len:217 (+) Transcript_25401:910-1560(+)